MERQGDINQKNKRKPDTKKTKLYWTTTQKGMLKRGRTEKRDYTNNTREKMEENKNARIRPTDRERTEPPSPEPEAEKDDRPSRSSGKMGRFTRNQSRKNRRNLIQILNLSQQRDRHEELTARHRDQALDSNIERMKRERRREGKET